MSLDNIVRSVAGRLSLRAPQAESLSRLHNALESVPALRDSMARSPAELEAMTSALAAQFSTLSDFEREFPSLCFALATGVGKTRLMGAFISYLHAAYGYKHFFVLAPNLTIYDKLIRDFTPNTPKYVFKGIAEFATTVPEVITGDNYEQRGSLSLLGGIEVNIFNISKINSEVRGGKAPRIKRLSEYLGQSYFEYLASLPDLVLIMDESHRYRASAGIRALNELKPLLGLELTATPFTESNRGPVPFKNVVMDYPLGRAIEDGFVKEPAVVTQQDFDPSAHGAEALERIKLMDGVRVHEETKVHLLTYAQQTGEPLVKPFMLVIARDTTHAAALMALVASDDFFHGRYKGKVIQVDSSRSGAEEEEMIRRLLAVESYDEPTEVVIHVNMLKEGWDVTNLYTIVPLRAANARTLIEQSIGRGLRLPYGRKTGVDEVDRLNIIAHDKFQEVIDEAGKGDSPIRMRVLQLAPDTDAVSGLRSVAVTPTINVLLGIRGTGTSVESGDVAAPTGLFANEQAKVAEATLEVVAELSHDPVLVPNSAALNRPEVTQEIIRRVEQRIAPYQAELLPRDGPSLAELAVDATKVIVEHAIDIPRIVVKQTGLLQGGYQPFRLDVSKMNFQPHDQQLVSRGLQSGRDVLYGQPSINAEARLENYIVRELYSFDEIPYDENADLLYDLAGQAVNHFRSYLKEDEEVSNILSNHGKAIAENIRLQMAEHYQEGEYELEVVVRQGFVPLKDGAATAAGDTKPLHWAPEDKRTIGQYVYGGFARCAYVRQKFHSDTERILAQILDREALRWCRPVSYQCNMFYRDGVLEKEYIPDFVAKTPDANLLIETKARKDLEDRLVKAKAATAVAWCKNASDYANQTGGKPWKYLLVPHDVVASNATLDVLMRRFAL